MPGGCHGNLDSSTNVVNAAYFEMIKSVAPQYMEDYVEDAVN